MCGRIWFLALALCSCARPVYIDSEKFVESTSQKQVSNCDAKFSDSDYCLTILDKSSLREDGHEFYFKVTRKNKIDESPIPVSLNELPHVELYMPSMGHGSSPVIVEQVEEGTYRAYDVYFIMKGDWEIKFQVKDHGAIIDEAKFALFLN